MAKVANPSRPRTRQNARAYGVLSAIPGADPYWFRPCYPRPEGAPPFYRGPCPPAPDGTAEAVEDVYGTFLHIGSLTVNAVTPVATDANGTNYYRVNLNRTQTISEEGIGIRRSVIHITEPGVYYANWKLNLPESASVNTTLALANAGEVIPESAVRVVKSPGCNTQSVSGQALIEVGEDDAQLSVVSSAAFDVQAVGAQDVIVSLTIIKIA